MFPPGYQLYFKNREYVEHEDEFDKMDEDGREVKPLLDDIEASRRVAECHEEEDVDIVSDADASSAAAPRSLVKSADGRVVCTSSHENVFAVYDTLRELEVLPVTVSRRKHKRTRTG
jgi:hypothetical protein